MFHIITRTKTGAISVFSPLLPSWKGGHCCTSILFYPIDVQIGYSLLVCIWSKHTRLLLFRSIVQKQKVQRNIFTRCFCVSGAEHLLHTHNTRTVSGEKRWRKNGRKMKRKKERDGKQSRITNFSGQEQQMPMSFFIFPSIYPYISKRLWNEMHDTNCMKWHLYSLAKKHSTIFINQFVCRLKYIILSFLSLTLPCTIRREQQQHPNKNEAGGRNWVRRTHK